MDAANVRATTRCQVLVLFQVLQETAMYQWPWGGNHELSSLGATFLQISDDKVDDKLNKHAR